MPTGAFNPPAGPMANVGETLPVALGAYSVIVLTASLATKVSPLRSTATPAGPDMPLLPPWIRRVGPQLQLAFCGYTESELRLKSVMYMGPEPGGGGLGDEPDDPPQADAVTAKAAAAIAADHPSKLDCKARTLFFLQLHPQRAERLCSVVSRAERSLTRAVPDSNPELMRRNLPCALPARSRSSR